MIGVFPLDFLAGHPRLDADWSEAVCELSDAAMAHELREGVCGRVSAGGRAGAARGHAELAAVLPRSLEVVGPVS
ncbi:MAG: hypothetical protein ACI906_002570 [Candidatus Latescibacterota bacterium]|jgi:hypothetical protein